LQGRHGEIKVGFQPENLGWIVLTIADNGVGLPSDLDFSTTETLGLRIVNTLARQLRGSVTVRNDHGAVFAVLEQVGRKTCARLHPQVRVLGY
jgi:two-component sensor histidine kinase